MLKSKNPLKTSMIISENVMEKGAVLRAQDPNA